MSNITRALLIVIVLTLGIFVPLGSWYWFGVRVPPETQLAPLQEAIPRLTRLLEAHEDDEVEKQLAQLPLTVIVTDAGKVTLSSNLGTTSRQHKEQGKYVLKNEALPFEASSDGSYRFYYRAPYQWFDGQLLFPLLFALLLGLLAALWDYLQRERFNDQTDTLILLNQQQHDEDKHIQRIKRLQYENKQLKEQLQNQGTLVKTKPRAGAAAALADVEKLQSSLKQMQTQNDALRKKLANAQHVPDDDQLHQELKELSQSLATTQDYEQALRQQIVEYEEQLHLMYEHQKHLTKDFEQAQERERDAKAQLKQLHELEQSVMTFRQQHERLLQKEERWSKEKRKLMSMNHAQREQNETLKAQIKSARTRVHELSVAYKKLNEKVDNLPHSLSEAQAMIAALIDAKDEIEQANLNLNLDNAERNSEIQRLYKELNMRAERLNEAQNMIEELAEELQRHQREMALLSETLEDKLADLEYAQDIHDEDQQVLLQITQERDQLRLEMEQLKDHLDVLREDKARLAFEKQNLTEELEKMDIEQFQLEIEQLRQSLQLMGTQQQRRNKTIEELKDKLKQGEELYHRLKNHSESQLKELRTLQQSSESYRAEIKELEDKIYTLESLQYGGK